jgi:hypothetical protein
MKSCDAAVLLVRLGGSELVEEPVAAVASRKPTLLPGPDEECPQVNGNLLGGRAVDDERWQGACGEGCRRLQREDSARDGRGSVARLPLLRPARRRASVDAESRAAVNRNDRDPQDSVAGRNGCVRPPGVGIAGDVELSDVRRVRLGSRTATNNGGGSHLRPPIYSGSPVFPPSARATAARSFSMGKSLAWRFLISSRMTASRSLAFLTAQLRVAGHQRVELGAQRVELGVDLLALGGERLEMRSQGGRGKSIMPPRRA